MTRLFDRLVEARDVLEPLHTDYRVVFEDPSRPECPAMVLNPDPNFMAAAVAGGILPPVDCYLRDAEKGPEEELEHPYAEPIGPLTEEEAVVYLIMKDLPRSVWCGPPSNRRRFRIVRSSAIPTGRTWRNAWVLSQEDAA